MNNMPCMFTDSVKTAIYLDCVGILLVMLMNQNSETGAVARWNTLQAISVIENGREKGCGDVF